MKGIKTFLLVLALLSMWNHVSAREVRTQEQWTNESDRSEEAISDALRPILRSTGTGARIDYHAICRQTSDNQKAVLFPRVKLHSSLKGVTGLEAVRRLFKYDPGVAVTQVPPSVIRIRVGTVEGALLQTKIPMLKLNPRQQYNPWEALTALEVTTEVRSAVRKLQLYKLPVVISERVLDPEPDLPHLPPLMKDVTMGQVLEAIAKTFVGIVSYGECINPADKTPCFVVTFSY